MVFVKTEVIFNLDQIKCHQEWVALRESHAKPTVESLSHFPNHSKKPARSWPDYFSVKGLTGPTAQPWLRAAVHW